MSYSAACVAYFMLLLVPEASILGSKIIDVVGLPSKTIMTEMVWATLLACIIVGFF